MNDNIINETFKTIIRNITSNLTIVPQSEISLKYENNIEIKSAIELLDSCKLINKRMYKLCLTEKKKILKKIRRINTDYTYDRFLCVDFDYIERTVVAKTLSMRQLAEIMKQTKDVLGKGYNVLLSSSSESGFRIEVPDKRLFVEIRFSCDRISVNINRQVLTIEEIMSLTDESLDENILTINSSSYFNMSILHQNLFLDMTPKIYENSASQFEYETLITCFSNVTNMKPSCSKNILFHRKMSPFKEWLISNRHKLKTITNLKTANDVIYDDYFPENDPEKMLHAFFWMGAEMNFIRSFVFLYSQFEKETFNTTILKTFINNCYDCGDIIDPIEFSGAMICGSYKHWRKNECTCTCFECRGKISNCYKHWPNIDIHNNCSCYDSESNDNNNSCYE